MPNCVPSGWRPMCLSRPMPEFVKLLILTGARRSEVAGMTWREVDLDAKLWTLPRERAKNGRQHTVPLSDLAAKVVLDPLPRSEFVFTKNRRSPICEFARLKCRLDALMPSDTAPWVLHDLRRSFASGCARLGVAIHVVEKCLNHSSGTFRGIVRFIKNMILPMSNARRSRPGRGMSRRL